MLPRQLASGVAIATVVMLCVLSVAMQAQADPRWDGLVTDSGRVDWSTFRNASKPNSLEERGIETDFSAEQTFEPEFQIDTFSDRLKDTLSSFDRNR